MNAPSLRSKRTLGALAITVALALSSVALTAPGAARAARA